MLYLYCRVSTDKQENGKDAQLSRLLQWAGDREVGGVFVDEDVSAHSVRFQDRPEGKRLYDRLEAGDIVVATKMDRMFRRLADFASAIDTWKQLGIRLVLLDMDVDISTPFGRAFAGWSAVAAQLESELHGQRKREVYAHRRQNGLPYVRTRPYGWEIKKVPRKGMCADRYYVPCERERKVGKEVLKRRSNGQSWASIALDFFHAGVVKPDGQSLYLQTDLVSLSRAAEAGYPKLPQSVWRSACYATTLSEAIASGIPL